MWPPRSSSTPGNGLAEKPASAGLAPFSPSLPRSLCPFKKPMSPSTHLFRYVSAQDRGAGTPAKMAAWPAPHLPLSLSMGRDGLLAVPRQDRQFPLPTVPYPGSPWGRLLLKIRPLPRRPLGAAVQDHRSLPHLVSPRSLAPSPPGISLICWRVACLPSGARRTGSGHCWSRLCPQRPVSARSGCSTNTW